MNVLCDIKYDQIKNILSGCKSSLDAYFITDIYCKKNPEMRNIMISMINGKKFENIHDFKTIKHNINEINNCQYEEEAYEIFDKICKRMNDQTHVKTLKRLIKNKPMAPVIRHNDSNDKKVVDIKKYFHHDKIKKKCPHCDYECLANPSISHVVCGYSDSHSGYDWKGCTKDWCFACGKMLCKNWHEHQLFQKNNCRHDINCCKKHAKKYSKNYSNDYCHCNNEYVTR